MTERWQGNHRGNSVGQGSLLGWAIRRVLLWVIAGTLVVLIITYRGAIMEELGFATAKAPASSTARTATTRSSSQARRTLIIPSGAGGHYFVTARVEDTDVRFVVDTGATEIVLSPHDAERIGLYLRDHHFTRKASTANGVVRAAPVTLRRLRIGALTLQDVDAVVNEAPMGDSLLGMGFLRRLEGYEVKWGKLILYW